MSRATTSITVACVMAAAVTLSACSTSTTPSAPPSQSTNPSTASAADAATTNPYAKLPAVPRLAVTSTSVHDGQQFATPQLSGLFGVPNGQDQSPQLSWTAGPAKTKSYVVTMYDADAPTGSGFWHWVVYDIPATTHTLPAGAGALKSTTLPKSSVQATNDAGMARYLGAAPPKGDQSHHYYLTVTALDTDKLSVAANASPAMIGFTISSHTLARGDIIATARG